MNSRKRPGMSSSSISTRERVHDWRRLVDRCGRKPSRKRIHELRVTTLRMQAELEIDLAEVPRASHLAQAILEFNRQGERLRRVLGSVREYDVWIAKLQALTASLAESAGYVPRSTRNCIRQIQRLETMLVARRSRSEKKLISAFAKHKRKFAVAAEELDRTLHDHANEPDENTENMVRARFAEVARDFPVFNEENLHEFRKRIKLVRYLAEIHASQEACAHFAAQLKKVQAVIGEWHDWQVLAQDIGEKRKMTELADLLGALAAESLASALATCYSITHKLTATHAPTQPQSPSRKLPVRDHFAETPAKKLA